MMATLDVATRGKAGVGAGVVCFVKDGCICLDGPLKLDRITRSASLLSEQRRPNEDTTNFNYLEGGEERCSPDLVARG